MTTTTDRIFSKVPHGEIEGTKLTYAWFSGPDLACYAMCDCLFGGTIVDDQKVVVGIGHDVYGIEDNAAPIVAHAKCFEHYVLDELAVPHGVCTSGQHETDEVEVAEETDEYLALGAPDLEAMALMLAGDRDAAVETAEAVTDVAGYIAARIHSEIYEESLSTYHEGAHAVPMWSGSIGKGEHVGEELARNIDRAKRGLPELPITWGMREGELTDKYSGPMPERITFPGIRGWLVRKLVGEQLDAQFKQFSDAVRLNQNLLDQATHQALHDPLTGLANRRRFSEDMTAQLARANRSNQSVGVVFIDVDHFKAINDEHGHEAGDEVLKEFAWILRDCVRAGDVVSRLGGDEFVIMLSNVKGEADVVAVLDKIERALEAPFGTRGVLEVSASMGAAISPKNGTTEAALLKAADDALYAAKEAGRHCYRMAVTSAE